MVSPVKKKKEPSLVSPRDFSTAFVYLSSASKF